MGVPRLAVWDDDDVSEHNFPMSAYRLEKDFMRPKVDALRDIVKEATGLVIDARREKYEGQELTDPVVVCVDTMEARQAVWRNARMNNDVAILIDTRTASKLLWVFAVQTCDHDDAAYYDHHVSYGSKQAAQHMCGLHGFMPMSLRAAGLVTENLTSWWMFGTTKALHHKEYVATPATAQEEA